jgi:hypothetical protein
MALEMRYSKQEYLLLICSRSTTGRSLANRLIVFMSAIFQLCIRKYEMSCILFLFRTINRHDTTYHAHVNDAK